MISVCLIESASPDGKYVLAFTKYFMRCANNYSIELETSIYVFGHIVILIKQTSVEEGTSLVSAVIRPYADEG